MSVPICFERTKEYLKSIGRVVPINKLRQIAVSLAEKQAHTLSPDAFTALAEDLFIKQLGQDATARRAARLINLQRAELSLDVIKQDIPKMNVVKKMEAWILGNSRRIGEAVNISVADIKKALTSQWLRSIRTVLNEHTGDLAMAESGLLTKDITQDLASLERGEGQASTSSQAFRIAQVYHSVMAQVFQAKQAFNPMLGRIEEYYYRASHDRVKITAAGKEAWVAQALKAYGAKSFPELSYEAKVQKFGDIYRQIERGVYESSLEFDASSGDIMSRQAHSRTLIPNDWESFHNYNQEFGRANVHTTIMRAVENASHDIAVTQKFGSDPAETFNYVMKKLLKTVSPEEAQALKQSKQKLADYFTVATQPGGAPATGQLAKFVRGFMGVETLAKNGSAFLRSWSDLANFTRRITDDVGGSYLSNLVEAVQAYGAHFGSNIEARRIAMEDMFLYSRSALHNLYQEVGAASSVTGTGPNQFTNGLNTLLEMQSKLSLMDRHISSVDAAMATVLSRRLGQMTETAFESLPKEAIQGLTRYGVGRAEWALLRDGVQSWEGHLGVENAMGPMDRLLNVDSILAIPDENIKAYLLESGKWKGKTVPKEAIIRERTELASKIGAMVNQHADAASSTAGLAERAWMYRNTDPNSLVGGGIRLIAQFKSAMIKNWDTQMRAFYSNPDKLQGDWSKVVTHVITSSGLWAMGEAAKSAFENKTVGDLSDPANGTRFALKALLSSGAGGLVGDSILTELTRSSNASDFASAAARGLVGPTVSTSLDATGALAFLGVSAAGGKFPGAALGKVVTQNVPFQNLFYSKALFNYYFANGVRDWLDAGYLSRSRRAMARGGQDQLIGALPPSEAAW